MNKNGKLEKRRRDVWLLVILLALGLACLVLPEAAESRTSDGTFVATEWVRRYNGPANSSDYATAMALDGQGNIYVTGVSWSGTSADFLTIKYSPDGRRLWTRRYNSPEDYYDKTTAMAVDGQGNVLVTGYSVKKWDRMNPSSTVIVTVKYDTNGQFLWERRYEGPVSDPYDNPSAIAVDAQGNVFVSGESYGGATGMDYATVKYSSDGEELWVRRYNGPANGYDGATAMGVDGQGNVYVTGESDNFGKTPDFLTIKYSPGGQQIWVRRCKDALPRAISVDGQGTVYITGNSWSAGNSDFLTVKYSPEGQRLWVRRYNGPANLGDAPSAIAVDVQGNVFVTGVSYGNGTDDDFATIKYSPEGRRLWVRRYNGPANDCDSPKAMALDGQGNVYVTGYSVGLNTSSDYATIKYSPDGRRLWVKRYNGAGNDYDSPTSIAVDGQGNVYVTGESEGSGSSNDYLTIKYTQTP
jgi:uncharacterized delta-60 repeat protein